jgi:hypothetical protein
MGGCEDGGPAACRLVDHLPELSACEGVYASCGFIQEDNVWAVNEGDGKSQLLLPSWRKLTYEVAALIGEV